MSSIVATCIQRRTGPKTSSCRIPDKVSFNFMFGQRQRGGEREGWPE